MMASITDWTKTNNANLKVDTSSFLETLKDFQKLIEIFPESIGLFVTMFDPKSEIVKLEHVCEGSDVVVRVVAEAIFRDFVSTLLEKKKEISSVDCGEERVNKK